MTALRLRYVVCLLVLLALSVVARADSYTLQGAGGNWSSNAIWLQNGVPASRPPGTLVGTPDTVALTASLYTVTLDFNTTENVTLTTSCPSSTSVCVLNVTTGGTLRLTGASTIGTDADLQLTGGTIDNSGTLTLVSTAAFAWSTGTLLGSGTTVVNSGATVAAAATGNVTLSSGQLLSLSGTLTQTNNVVNVDSGASISINSGALYDLQTINGIGSDGAGTITVQTGGQFRKTAGSFGTNILPVLNNHGIVRTDVNTLVITGGTHDGLFDMNGAGTGIGFAGNPTMQAGTVIQGAGSATFGSDVTLTGAVTATNLEMTSFGSMGGAGSLTISGAFSWRGGAINGPAINMQAGSSINVTGESNASLNASSHLTNDGSITFNPGVGAFSINGGGHITNNATRTITIAGDITIGTNNVSNPRIDNAGILNKSAGVATASLLVPVNNTGTITVNAGTLSLGGNGNHTGAFLSSGASTKIQFAGGTHTFTGGTFTGPGGFKVSGATMDFDAAISIGQQFVQAAGVITGNANVTFAAFTWEGGTMDASGGTGVTVLSGNALFDGQFGAMTLSGRTLTINSSVTVNYTPATTNYLSIDTGANLSNNGLFNINGDVPINSNQAGGAVFNNNPGATLTKNAGSGFSRIASVVNNNGTVTVASGQLAFNGGGTNASTINIPGPTNILAFEDKTYTFSAGSSTGVGNLGALRIDGVNAVLLASSLFSTDNVELELGKLVASNMTIGKKLLWTGGIIQGPGSLNLANGSLIDHTTPAAATTLDNIAFNNSGTFTYDATAFSLTLTNSAILNNAAAGTFESIGNGAVLNGAGSNRFQNVGLLRKTGGTSGTRFDVALDNLGGTISSEVNGQSLIVNGGGSMTTGVITTTGSALFDFFGGTFNASGGNFTGTGKVKIVGGTLNVVTSINAATLEVDSGILDVSASTTFQISTLEWNGGTIQGGGTTRVFGGFISATAPTLLDGTGTLTIAGTFSYDADATNHLVINSTAKLNIESGSTMTITSNGVINGPNTGRITSGGGTLDKTGVATARIDTPIDFTSGSGGTIHIGGGILQLGGGGTIGGSAGSMQIAGELAAIGGTLTINASATMSGTGVFRVNGGTVTVNTPLTFPVLMLDAGLLNGSANVGVDGGKWTGGDMDGTGTTKVNAGKTFELSTATVKKLRRNFTNDGTVLTQNLPAAITFENAAVFTNNGLVQFQENTNVFCACTPTPAVFHNASGATLTQFNAAGTSNFLTVMNNDGTVDTQTGILNYLAGGTHTGTFTAGANTLHSFAGAQSFSGTVNVSGTGAVTYAGTTSFGGTHNLTGNGLTIVDGAVTFLSASPILTPALEMRSGSIGGTSAIEMTGGGSSNSAWEGGTIGGSGLLKLDAGATMDWSGSVGGMTLDGRTFTNLGTVTYTSASVPVAFSNSASFSNLGVFDIQTDMPLNVGPGTNSFDNQGTFKKTAGTLTTHVQPVFTTSSVVTFASGTVAFDGGFTQTAGSTTLNGGHLASPLTVNINGGTLGGSGNVTANVSNAGNVNPGLSPGGLTINGLYAQAPSGALNIELQGTTPITLYDQLTVTGTATLGGTMNVTLIGGFVPADGDVFDVLAFGSSTGTFATENLPTFASGGSFTSSYQPAAYRITAQTTQADVSVSQTNSGPALHGQNAVFTVTVTNQGPDTATGVTLTDTMTGAALVSASSTIGSCNTATPIVCNIGTLNSGQSAIITITVSANTVGTINNSATVTATEFDPNTGNNATGTSAVTVSAAADLGVTVTDSPDPVSGGASTIYTVTVNNAGPDNATSAAVALTVVNGSIVTTSSGVFICSGSATNQTCTAGSPLATGSFIISVTVQAPSASGVMSLKAVASSGAGDPTPANNSQTQATTINVSTDLSIVKSGPSSVAPGATVAYTIVVTNIGLSDAANVVVLDPTPPRATFVSNTGACSTPFPCSLGTIVVGQQKTITATYVASSNRANEGRTISNTATVSTTTPDSDSTNDQDSAVTTIQCLNAAPDHLAPANAIVVPASGTLTWNGNGQSYTVFMGPAGSGCSMQFGTATTESLPYSSLTPGATYEWRVESERGQCGTKTSSCVTFKVENNCTRPETPLARVVGQQTSAKTYAVEWDAVPGAVRYEIDEATNAQFTDATTFAVQGLSKEFNHTVNAPAAFHYRVRAFNECFAEPSANSLPVRVVIIPLVPDDKPSRNVNVPAGTKELVIQQVLIPGEPGASLFFSATTDRPWLTVRPSSGPLPPQGTTVEVIADPATLPNGTFTASLIVSVTTGASKSGLAPNGGATVVVPVSINLVTPVSPVPAKEATSQYAMIIPSVGHLDGINSFWQSDVRITNAGLKAYRYRLTFTPAGGTSAGVKQTTITVDAGATTALDDIVRNWYGLGALGDNGGGMLEILPLDEPAISSAATVASSRTYNVTDNGTLGQFIPAIRFPSFIGQPLGGAAASILSLQQVAESAAYRTNLGVLEASGNPVSVLLNVFNSAGAKLLTVPMQLAAGEQRQLNGFLAANNLSLGDGRVEVQVSGGTGKVSAYASVIDNNTRDPLLVNGTLLAQSNAARWTLPGVANIDNPVAHWRTDMRVFNYGAAVQPATLTFHPGGNGAPKSVAVTLDPGSVLTLDDVLQSKFGVMNAGGVVQVSTGASSSLVVTGRTYNQTSTGTFGQFIPAVTTEEAVGAGGPTLHILQVEDSSRYRTNIGLAEVTGSPAVVELQVILPDSKFTLTVQVPLAANEFRQFSLLRDLALGNVYNARVTAKVISGNGRVTAYGSVIDEQTQDPTYVPAQK